MSEIIPHTMAPYELDEAHNLIIPEGTTQEAWSSRHATLFHAKRKIGRWVKQSHAYGIDHFGEEVVSATESQVMLALGDTNAPKPKPDLNGEGKARGLATIEGISQGFQVWHRTVDHLIPNWDRPQLERALELLEPMEREAKRLREMLETPR